VTIELEERVITRTLGRTGLSVSRLGLGCVEIDTVSPESPPHLSLENNAKLLHAALDAGINVIDTAECYGNSEEQIGAAIGSRRDDYYLFTKCGHAAIDSLPDWDSEQLTRSIERSLRRLRTDRIDVLFLHSCSAQVLRHGAALQVLEEAKAAGKVRYLGYSGDGAAAEYAVLSGQFDVLETSVSIVDQEAITRTLPLARERQLGVVAKRPIANAIWASPTLPASPYVHSYWHRYQTLLGRYGWADEMSSADSFLRFVLSLDEVDTSIVGTANVDHLADNVASVRTGPLPPSERDRIRREWAQAARGTDWAGER
jgi:aryl-alcohol dehydrogenase-like predicted oxidoreductase